MRYIAVCLAGLISALAVGYGSNLAQPRGDAAPPKERATALAKQVRKAMTEPSIMQLEFDAGRAAASGGLRGIRQREAAKTSLRQLVQCGKAAEEPLGQLINDADESVRLASIILLSEARTDAEGKPIESQTLIDLNIPLMERALTSKDAKVRYRASGGLGDFADWSDECLERLRISLSNLRELRNDKDKEVRSIGWIACNGILAKLSTRAKKPEDRKAAADEWKQLQQEKW